MCISVRILNGNEFLTVLTHYFDAPRAARVMQMTNDFWMSVVNKDFPPWFLLLMSASRIVALRKPETPAAEGGPTEGQPTEAEAQHGGGEGDVEMGDPDEARDQRARRREAEREQRMLEEEGHAGQPATSRDARPINVGEAERRAVISNLIDGLKTSLASHLAPQQVSVGVSGGLSIMYHGIRLLLDVQRDFVVVKIDLKNAFNAVDRKAILEALANVPEANVLLPFELEMLGPEGLAFTQEGKRLFRGERGDKSAGTDQGSPDSPALFCIALAPALRRLHEALAGLGGGAWACMDDAYAVGPAEPVFEALADFARSVNDELHMEVCFHKMKAYSRERDLTGFLPMEEAGVTLGGVDTAENGFMRGIQVGGIPLGDPGYMAYAMGEKATEIESYINNTVNQLRSEPHHLWTCLYYGVKSKIDYWLQHVTPAESGPYARRVDAAMQRAIETVARRPGAMQNDFIRRRMEQPVRVCASLAAASAHENG